MKLPFGKAIAAKTIENGTYIGIKGDLLTFGYLMLDDSLGYPYFRLFNGNP